MSKAGCEATDSQACLTCGHWRATAPSPYRRRGGFNVLATAENFTRRQGRSAARPTGDTNLPAQAAKARRLAAQWPSRSVARRSGKPILGQSALRPDGGIYNCRHGPPTGRALSAQSSARRRGRSRTSAPPAPARSSAYDATAAYEGRSSLLATGERSPADRPNPLGNKKGRPEGRPLETRLRPSLSWRKRRAHLLPHPGSRSPHRRRPCGEPQA